jgi:hypothetical protein
MTEKEIWDNAWSFPPEVRARGNCIATIQRGGQNYYFYESGQPGTYWYETDAERARAAELRKRRRK